MKGKVDLRWLCGVVSGAMVEPVPWSARLGLPSVDRSPASAVFLYSRDQRGSGWPDRLPHEPELLIVFGPDQARVIASACAAFREAGFVVDPVEFVSGGRVAHEASGGFGLPWADWGFVFDNLGYDLPCRLTGEGGEFVAAPVVQGDA